MAERVNLQSKTTKIKQIIFPDAHVENLTLEAPYSSRDCRVVPTHAIMLLILMQ